MEYISREKLGILFSFPNQYRHCIIKPPLNSLPNKHIQDNQNIKINKNTYYQLSPTLSIRPIAERKESPKRCLYSPLNYKSESFTQLKKKDKEVNRLFENCNENGI